jgi:hypothetical protein
MADTLGARLVRAGLLTRDLLSQAIALGARSGFGLPEALVRCGVSEDALAGFFVSEGYGPLLEGAALAAPDREAAGRIGRTMSTAFLALPLRRGPDGYLVALADPSDEHALGEIERRLGAPARPRAARVNELRRAIDLVLAREDVSDSASHGAAVEAIAPKVETKLELAAARAPRSAKPAGAGGRRWVGAAPVPFALPDLSAADAGWGDLDAAATAEADERRPMRSPRPAPQGPRGRLAPKTQPASALTAPGDAGVFLAAIRSAGARDEVLLMACEGALTVARAAVFLGVRKGVLVGREGVGPGISRDAVRNLWIPTTSASVFKRVLDTGKAHHGPCGTAPADQLFRAATGSRGAGLVVQPVFVGLKVTGVLCADGVRYGEAGEERLAVLGHAIGEGFKRLILAQKR